MQIKVWVLVNKYTFKSMTSKQYWGPYAHCIGPSKFPMFWYTREAARLARNSQEFWDYEPQKRYLLITGDG